VLLSNINKWDLNGRCIKAGNEIMKLLAMQKMAQSIGGIIQPADNEM
jgi:hypothetical protein